MRISIKDKIGILRNVRIMKKNIVITLLSFLPLMMYAQASGGQIRREKAASNSKASHNNLQNKYMPVDMEPNIYYLCLNETWNVKNGQDLCRKMAAKGYTTVLVKNPNSDYGYHVCVKKELSQSSAREFIKAFKDDRYRISYIYYNGELVEIVTEGAVSIQALNQYNVVIGSFSSLSEAQDLCGVSRAKLLSGEIYYDASLRLYRVISMTTDQVKDALHTINLPFYKKTWPNALIMQVINGQLVEYSNY